MSVHYGYSERDYFHDSATGEHRSTPPVTDGRALDTWEADRARHIERCHDDDDEINELLEKYRHAGPGGHIVLSLDLQALVAKIDQQGRAIERVRDLVNQNGTTFPEEAWVTRSGVLRALEQDGSGKD